MGASAAVLTKLENVLGGEELSPVNFLSLANVGVNVESLEYCSPEGVFGCCYYNY